MTTQYLLLSLALLIANGFFVGAEFALVAARRSKIEQLAEDGNTRARLALRELKELSLMLAGAQLGITMASLGLGALAEPAVARLIEEALHGFDLPSGVLHSISFVIALTIVVFFHMVIGEMAPKNVAIAEPEKTALWIAVPFRIYVVIFKPFILFLNAIANAGVKVLGIEPIDEREVAHSSDEIGLMIHESARGGYIDKFEHRLLSGAVAFSERDAAAVMVPRTDMTAVPRTATATEIEQIVKDSGHSRLPVYGKDLDHILGFLHAKDLLRVKPKDRERPIQSKLIRQMLVVPESRKLHPLLRDMRRERQQFALVLDEHGGTAGVVTLEDLLEELVGEIRDEYDVSELDVRRLSDHRFIVPGSLHINDANERLGMNLPEGEYETIAGFIMDRLGRIPKSMDVVEHDSWKMQVRSMDRRRVVQVLVERTTPPPAPEPG